MSLGHLMAMFLLNGRSTSIKARVSNWVMRNCWLTGKKSGRSKREKVRFFPSSLSQLLPIWPRPAVCLSHHTTVNSGSSFFVSMSRKRALDRKSTRLNSSHVRISYAVFCLNKKNPTLIAAYPDIRVRYLLYIESRFKPAAFELGHYHYRSFEVFPE